MEQLDVKFFKPFVDGTIQTIKTQCSTDISAEKPFIKGTQTQPPFELAGVIGITSPTFNGSITLCFPGPVFLGLMSNMFGETFTTISKDLQSGAAELLNIIFGTAKTVLINQGYSIQKAIPTVISGAALETNHIAEGRVMVLPFKTSVGEFHIEISAEGHSL